MTPIFFYRHMVIMVSIVREGKNMTYNKNAKIHQSGAIKSLLQSFCI